MSLTGLLPGALAPGSPGLTILLALAHLVLTGTALWLTRYPVLTGFHVFLGAEALAFGLRPLLAVAAGGYTLYGIPDVLAAGNGAPAGAVLAAAGGAVTGLSLTVGAGTPSVPGGGMPTGWEAYNRGLAYQALFSAAAITAYVAVQRFLDRGVPSGIARGRGIRGRGNRGDQPAHPWHSRRSRRLRRFHPWRPGRRLDTWWTAWLISLGIGLAAVAAIHLLSGGAWLPGRRAATVTAVVPLGKLLFPLAVIPLSASLPLAWGLYLAGQAGRIPGTRRPAEPLPGGRPPGGRIARQGRIPLVPARLRSALLLAGSAVAAVLLVLLYQRGFLLNALVVAAFLHERWRGWSYTRLAALVAVLLVLLGVLRPLAGYLSGRFDAAPPSERTAAAGSGTSVQTGDPAEPRSAPALAAQTLAGALAGLPRAAGHFLLKGATFDHADVWVLAQGYAAEHGFRRGSTLAAIPARFLTPPARQATRWRTAADLLNEYRWKHFYWQTRFGFNVTLPQEFYLNFGPWPLPAAGVLAGLLAAGGDRWLWRRGARRSGLPGAPPEQHRDRRRARGVPVVVRPSASGRSEGRTSPGFRPGARLTVAAARRLHPGIPPVLPGGPGWVYGACALFAAGGFVKEPGATLQWTLAYLMLGGAVGLAARAVTRTVAPRTKSVVILRSNPVAPDPRVERVARTLAREGFRVTVVGWDREGSFPELELAPYGPVVRLRARGRYGAGPRNLPALLRWQLQLVYWLRFHRRHYSIIHACDFDTLVPALLVKLLLGKGVVYDIFDWYADTVRGLPGFLRRGLARVDRWLLGWADAVILADENRLPQLGKARPRRLEIVYNSPDWDPKDVIRGLPSSRGLRLAYIGLLQADRGLLELLEVMRRHPEWELDLGGFGAEEYLIRGAAAALPNVRFHGRVPHHRCMEVYVRADVLVATYDPSVPNYRYSSPNKLFEAMRLGKPIVVAEGTGIDRRVKAWELGYVVPYGDTGSLENALQDAAGWTGEERRAFAVRVRRIYDEHFSWRIMSRRLLGLYDDMPTSIAPPTSSR